MDMCRNSGAFTSLQHRYCILLVHFQSGNCLIYRFFKGCNRMGIQLCHFLFRHVGGVFRKCSRKRHSQVLPHRRYLLCAGYGGYRIFHILRRAAPKKPSGINRYLCVLWLYHGYRSWHRLPLSGQNTYALV